MFLDATGQPHPDAALRAHRPPAPAARCSRGPIRPIVPSVGARERTAGRRVRALGALLRIRCAGLSLAQRSLVRGDVVTVLWWADAMQRAGTRAPARCGRFLLAVMPPPCAAMRLRAGAQGPRERAGRHGAADGGAVRRPVGRAGDGRRARRRGTMEGVVISYRFAVRYADEDHPRHRSVRARGPPGIAGCPGGCGRSGSEWQCAGLDAEECDRLRPRMS